MSEDWRYQVWMHSLLDKKVVLWNTYDTRKRAEDEALSMNLARQHDTPDGATIDEFFYVRPIAVRDLLKPRGNAYRRLLIERKEEYMSTYKGELRAYGEHLVLGMLSEIKSCVIHKVYLMEEEGGILSCEGENFDGLIKTRGFIVYHGNNRISFEVAFTCGVRYVSRVVKVFRSSKHVMAWLSDTETAAVASEKKLIELLNDPFYGLLSLLKE